jgi:hypothetical protein
MGPHWRHFDKDVLDHDPANRGEGVPVVKTNWGKFVAAAANLQSLPQGKRCGK